jgi:predicted DNA-binding transcriptional regulator YafY
MSSKLGRLLKTDQLIRSGRYPSVHTLIAEFEMGERTIYEDLEYLRIQMNAPLKYSRTHKGYYYTNATWSLPTIMATEGELLAFFLSAELTARYLGTAIENPLRSAIAKLARYLPDALPIDLGQLTQHFTITAGATSSANPELLVALSNAIVERHPIQITYYTASRGERNQRLIEPYHLYNVRGDWQIIGFDHLRQNFRNFAVARIETWDIQTYQRFQRDPDFSIRSHLATGFLAERGDAALEIVIWFDPYQARYIRERQWHPTQQFEEQPDGSLLLRFRSGALDEVRRWVMSYGSHARVLAPESLASAIRNEIHAMIAHYPA